MKAFDHKSLLSSKCVAVSVRKLLSLSKMSRNNVRNSGNVHDDDIVKCGHLKKLKEGSLQRKGEGVAQEALRMLDRRTMRKKFFVLRKDTGPDSPARLEYYDNERRFRSGALPKKPIILRSCFSINRKKDAKHNHVIALYTNQDSVSVAAESEAELNEWLDSLKYHMQHPVADTDDQSRKMYEHVWLVEVQQRSLGSSKNLVGEYRICLTYKSIAMVRVGDCQKKIEFPLNSIRRCGHTGQFFFLGLGRSAVTGAGDLWMLTEDAVIAENMHNIIQKAMHEPYNNMNEEPPRERTQSVSLHRSFDGPAACHPRSRCGSMPTGTRSRTSSEGSVQAPPNKLPPPNCSHQLDGPGQFCHHPITRPKSMYTSSFSSCSPPFASALFRYSVCPVDDPYQPLTPGSSESVGSTTSVDEFDGTPEVENAGIGEEESYVEMGGDSGSSGSVHGRDHLQSSITLPLSRNLGLSFNKGLLSPGSGSSMDGPGLSSPQDNYMDMYSPSTEHMPLGGILGSLSDRGGYMVMDRMDRASGQGSTASDNSGYLSMGPLNSPGSTLPSWPPHTSSQVSSPPHSANHSRIPSLVDDSTDSYLSMTPGSHINEVSSAPCDISQRDRDGYLNMTVTPAIPLPCSPSDGDSFPEMSPGSSCSFTSGTPSSDHRFPEFIAEKSGSGSYCGYSEDDDSSIERPIRTNSVGSKPEQFRSRKNRLEVSPAEPARVRAFSVGSRIGLRLAGGRTGYMAGGASAAAASASIMEFSPSIKEKGRQVKSKSTSAPILGSSPISNSWSGTPGTFFRGFLQNRSQERSDLMEFDFTKNKSCDSITAEKEKKSSSIEGLRRTLTGQRHRSNSKSSGNGKSSVFDSMKRDKKKSESESSGKGIEIPNRKNYFELDISPSPRRNTADSNNGYLPMNIKPSSIPLSQSSTSEYLDMSSKDPINRQSFTDSYMQMSMSSDRIVSSAGTALPHEGYVDMSQGKGIGPLTPVSSSSTSSNSSSFIGARVRKISSTLIPMSSQDTSSQLDEYMRVDFRSNADSSSQSHDGEKLKKKDKKSMKRKSFKESTKRKKSEPIAVIGKGENEVVQENSRKGTSPLSHLSTFLSRKNSSGTPPKTPLSPTGSPLPKSSRGTPSPFSSLTRSKNRDGKDSSKDSAAKDSSGGPILVPGFGAGCIEESSREAEESAISSDSTDASVSGTSVPNSSEQLGKSSSKRSSGVFESSQVNDTRTEDKHATHGLELGSRLLSTISQQQSETSGDMGSYVNLSLGTSTSDKKTNLSAPESKARKVSTGSMSDYMNISPMPAAKLPESEASNPSHNYVNMCPGSRRLDIGPPSLSQPTSQSDENTSSSSSTIQVVSKNSDTEKGDICSKRSPNLGSGSTREQNRRESKRLSGGVTDDGGSESGYLLMTPGQPPPKTASPKVVARRPDIPPALLGGRPEPSLSANLERLNLGGPGGGISLSERSRSHSGPGAPEGSAVGGEVRVKKQLSEPRVGSGGQGNSGRAASACSSPVSYSPPTSPTLGGSVSSVSSLSEGGLSSASSTCTVVNVGIGRRESGLAVTGRTQDNQSDSTSSTSASSVSSSQQSSSATISSGSGDSGLNYVALDLGPARCEGVMPSPRASRRRTASGNSTKALGTGSQDSTVGEEDFSLSYAQIDFTKSEGLRTTSLSRDHRH